MLAPVYSERQSAAVLLVTGSNEVTTDLKWRWFAPEGWKDGSLYLFWVHDDVAPGTPLKCIAGSVHHGLCNVYDIECTPAN